MKKTDLELLAEAYEQVNEGLFDRLKARGAQAVGAVKGAGQQITGKVQQAAGSTLSKAAELGGKALGVDASQGGLAKKGAELQSKGGKAVSQGQRAAEEAKYTSYIDNSAKTISTDLAKLGMAVKDEATLIKDIKAAIVKNLTQVTAKGQLRTGAGTIGGKVV